METSKKKFGFIVTRKDVFTAEDMQIDDGLIELGGCADYGNKFGLGAFQVEFDVEVLNKKTEEIGKFTVVFQTEERNNGLMNYSGSEMVTGSLYGCDADESGKLLTFCDDDEEVIDVLHNMAKHEATKELERLLSEMETLTINDDSSGFSRPQGG